MIYQSFQKNYNMSTTTTIINTEAKKVTPKKINIEWLSAI